MGRYEIYYLLPGLVGAYIFVSWGIATMIAIPLWLAGVGDAALISAGVQEQSWEFPVSSCSRTS